MNVLVKKLSILLFSLSVLSLSAQPMKSDANGGSQDMPYSETEINQFIEVVKEMIPVQQEAQQQMISEVENQGIKVDRFNEIASVYQEGKAEEADVSKEELKVFETASAKVTELQQQLDTQIKTLIESSGLGLEKYQEIMMAYQQNPQLKQLIDSKMM